jgi:hypothetical protein
MRGWRIKFVFLLIVYFAGFATAIYTLGPAPENQAQQRGENSFPDSVFKSDQFAKSFNSGMHKCIEFGKEAAVRAGKTLKEKLEEKPIPGNG